MSRAGKTLAALAVVLVVALTALLLYPRFKTIKKKGPESLAYISATVPESTDATAQAIVRAYEKGFELDWGHGKIQSPIAVFRARLFLHRFGDGLFPDDFQLKSHAEKDPALEQYLGLPRDQRKHDFYLVEPTGVDYWESEYLYRGEPARFRCGFIIHLEPQDARHTKIEVLEYLPTIWVGEYFGWSAHTGPWPGFFYDIRVVAPTTRDRLELLKRIEGAVAQPPQAGETE